MSLEEERASSYLYAAMERVEEGKAAQLFGKLREASERQSKIWEVQLANLGAPIPRFTPSARVRVVEHLLVWLGPRRLLPVLAAMKVRGLTIYRAAGFDAETAEQASVAATTPAEKWHRAAQGGGALRAAVFGMNDGLVSNASLIIGVAGGAVGKPEVVLLAGVAGLIAGGFSMAAGEYISVATQREMFEHQIALEKAEMAVFPEEEIEELTMIYESKGLSRIQAASLAAKIVGDPVHGLDTLAREELGIDPEGLASPVAAALASFGAFAIGALIPLVPYLVIRSSSALSTTVAVTEAGLLGVGAVMSLFTGRSMIWSALRMALIGSAAAAITFVIGHFLGVSIS
jgi:VIT1/CCC1 family predicted Fe2+/Mn2+ transporter